MTYLNDRELFFKGDTASSIKLTKPSNKIGFKRLSPEAIIPTKAHPTDSGYDLYASEDVIIEPGETKVIPTGIAIQLPEGTEAQVRPRSGITAKTKLRVQLGTIDNGYKGEIGVIVDNIAHKEYYLGVIKDVCKGTEESAVIAKRDKHFRQIDGSALSIKKYYQKDGINWVALQNTYIIRKGERIAQIVVQALPTVESVEIDDFTEDSERGEGGFGSSGV